MNFQSLKLSDLSLKIVHIVAFTIILGIFGGAFFVSLAELELAWKILALSAATMAFGGIFFGLYRFNKRRAADSSGNQDSFVQGFAGQLNSQRQNYLAKAATDEKYLNTSQDQFFNEEVEAKIAALREMRVLLGSALSLADSFRMVSSQVAEFVPFTTCVLFQPSETKQKLFVVKAVGEAAEFFERFSFEIDEGLAAQVFTAKKAALDLHLTLDLPHLPESLQFFSSAVAVPLFKEGEVFAVLAFYTTNVDIYDSTSVQLLEKLSLPMSDFLYQSLMLERNQASALTDPLTKLPNERAFCLLLEQRIAESHRFRGARSFSLLSFDIENFAEINNLYGYLAGDELLSSVAFLVKTTIAANGRFSALARRRIFDSASECRRRKSAVYCQTYSRSRFHLLIRCHAR